MYGHVAKLADEIKKGASSVEGVEAKIWQVGTYLLCCTNFFFFNNKHETCVSSILR
jgi:multimeric flavodoxin WrbA